VLSGVGYEDQYHLPQASLDIDVSLASEGPAAAVAVATETLERYDLSMSSPRYVWPLLASAANAVRVASGDPGTAGDDAAALLHRLRTLAGKLEVFGPVQRAWQLSFAAIDPGAHRGTGDFGDFGDAAGTTGADAPADAVGVLAAADEATEAWDALGQPYTAAVMLVRAARAALAGASPAGRAAAMARLHRAAPIAERLGARPLAEQITDLARQAGEAAGEARTPAGPDRLGLTGREFEVFRLVAAGQSNREIAKILFISPKTASVHVSNILAKLGTASRTEAAAKAHALRLFDIPVQQ
jgi:DNA-binding CsgD family transcriptional regulator